MTPVDARHVRLGFWLGVLAMVLFSVTVPATRLATGSDAAPQLSPFFVSVARAAIAGLLSAAYLLAVRARVPTWAQWKWLLLATAGNVIGWPLLLALALRSVTAVHAAVIVAVVPLATAAAAAWVLREREGAVFWTCAIFGAVLVVLFSLLRARSEGGFHFDLADGLLLLSVVATSVGYTAGARVTPELGAERVISWVCVVALPLSIPAVLWAWPDAGTLAHVGWPAWAGVVYVGAVSMWSGFFAWYRGMDWAGAMRMSQVLLVQPFLSMLVAVPMLGEHIDALSIAFALAVVATVFVGRRKKKDKAQAKPA